MEDETASLQSSQSSKQSSQNSKQKSKKQPSNESVNEEDVEESKEDNEDEDGKEENEEEGQAEEEGQVDGDEETGSKANSAGTNESAEAGSVQSAGKPPSKAKSSSSKSSKSSRSTKSSKSRSVVSSKVESQASEASKADNEDSEESGSNPKDMAEGITEGLEEPAEKFKALWNWVTTHIHIKGTAENFVPNATSAGVLASKKTTEQGMARLLQLLCRHVNLNIEVVDGLWKGSKGFSPNTKLKMDVDGLPASQEVPGKHAWNIVTLDGKTMLCDPSAAAGRHLDDGSWKQDYDDRYLNMDPQETWFSRWPFTPSNQLIEPPNTDFTKWRNSPYLHCSPEKIDIKKLSHKSATIKLKEANVCHMTMKVSADSSPSVYFDNGERHCIWGIDSHGTLNIHVATPADNLPRTLIVRMKPNRDDRSYDVLRYHVKPCSTGESCLPYPPGPTRYGAYDECSEFGVEFEQTDCEFEVNKMHALRFKTADENVTSKIWAKFEHINEDSTDDCAKYIVRDQINEKESRLLMHFPYIGPYRLLCGIENNDESIPLACYKIENTEDHDLKMPTWTYRLGKAIPDATLHLEGCATSYTTNSSGIVALNLVTGGMSVKKIAVSIKDVEGSELAGHYHWNEVANRLYFYPPEIGYYSFSMAQRGERKSAEPTYHCNYLIECKKVSREQPIPLSSNQRFGLTRYAQSLGINGETTGVHKVTNGKVSIIMDWPNLNPERVACALKGESGKCMKNQFIVERTKPTSLRFIALLPRAEAYIFMIYEKAEAKGDQPKLVANYAFHNSEAYPLSLLTYKHFVCGPVNDSGFELIANSTTIKDVKGVVTAKFKHPETLLARDVLFTVRSSMYPKETIRCFLSVTAMSATQIEVIFYPPSTGEYVLDVSERPPKDEAVSPTCLGVFLIVANQAAENLVTFPKMYGQLPGLKLVSPLFSHLTPQTKYEFSVECPDIDYITITAKDGKPNTKLRAKKNGEFRTRSLKVGSSDVYITVVHRNGEKVIVFRYSVGVPPTADAPATVY